MVRKIGRYITNLIFALLAIAILLCVIGFGLGWKARVVLSGSMEPAIHTGSISIIDTKAEYKNVRVGDVVAFEAGESTLVHHRVLKIHSNGLETKGDANEDSDGITTVEDNFRGKQLFSIPMLGYAIVYLQTSRGKIIAVTAFIVLLMVSFLCEPQPEDSEQIDERRSCM